MTKIRLLLFLVAGLFMINVLLAGFILIHKPPRHPGHDPKSLITRKLHFDREQAGQYELLVKKHQQTLREANQMIRKLKNLLYAQLNKESNPDIRDSIIREINHIHYKIELAHLEHFAGIKKICNPAQLVYYRELTSELSDLFSPPPVTRK